MKRKEIKKSIINDNLFSSQLESINNIPNEKDDVNNPADKGEECYDAQNNCGN